MTDFRKLFGNKIPVILDTDTANEADDQFAMVYSALSDNVDLLGVTVSPFSNGRERDTAKAVKMCYDEAKKFVALTGKNVPVIKAGAVENQTQAEAQHARAQSGGQEFGSFEIHIIDLHRESGYHNILLYHIQSIFPVPERKNDRLENLFLYFRN